MWHKAKNPDFLLEFSWEDYGTNMFSPRIRTVVGKRLKLQVHLTAFIFTNR